MANEGVVLTTAGLSQSDQADLLDFLPVDAVEFRPVKLPAGELGEPMTAIAIISLSFVAITSICAWLSVKGKGVKFSASVNAPGVAAAVNLTLTNESKPEAVREELEKQGVQVPDGK